MGASHPKGHACVAVNPRSRRFQFLVASVLAMLVFGLLAVRAKPVPGVRVQAQPLIQQVVATGRVLSVSRVQVGSEITGVVLERRVGEGDVVAAGDVLAVLRADDLAAQVRAGEAALNGLRKSTRPQSQVALREAQAQLAQAERELERRRDLFARGLIAREGLEQAEQAAIVARAAAQTARLNAQSLSPGGSEEVTLSEQLAAARAALDKTIIRSQVAGVVLTRNAEPGDLVQPGKVLFDIAREGDTEVLVPFDEKNLALLRLGQRAQCIADAFPNEVFAGEIAMIAPRVDPQRGVVDVRLRVKPVPEFLRQDMTVSVSVQTGARERAIVVPNDALMNIGGQQAQVWVARDGRAQRVGVRLGLRALTMTEIVEGLNEGEQVLLEREDAVMDGERVRVIEAAPTPTTTSRE